MKKGRVVVRYDELAAAPLTAGEEAELARLAASRGAEVDTSDIPLLDERFWTNAVTNPFYRPVKQQLTVRVDADVIAWLRAGGDGYQTRLNAILRKAMVEERAGRSVARRVGGGATAERHGETGQ